MKATKLETISYLEVKMNASLKNTTIELHRHGVERITNVKSDSTIVCEKGVLWLTQANDRHDYILLAGDRFAKPQRGKVLVEAIRDAVVRVI
jgi:hypothetical protein